MTRRPMLMPRLLPCAMLAMVALLGWKSVALVHAETAVEKPPVAAEAKPAEVKPAGVKPAAAMAPERPPEPPPVGPEERALLLDLRQRRAALEAREAEFASRAGVLAAAEKRLQARMDELAGLQRRIEALETARQARDQASLRSMVKVYETMRAKDAALIFNDLDAGVLLPVADQMKENKLAAVLAAMQPDRARRLTSDLAQMRSRLNQVPTHS